MDKYLFDELERRRSHHLFRSRRVVHSPQGAEVIIDGRRLLCFCSNDYLGLANHPEVIEALRQGALDYGVGSGAAHLVCGHHAVHHALEEELAAFTRRPRALLFSTGYMANLGVVSTFAHASYVVHQDRLNHASLIDGGLLSAARLQRYPHGDTDTLEHHLEQKAQDGQQAMIVSDGVFSMDGDLAPLPALADLAQRYAACLVIDDAHGLGVLGKHGGGTLEHFGMTGADDVHVLVGTLGKAFGSFGAFVAGSEEVVETLIQEARTYMYTTALPPALAQATRVSLRLAQAEQWRRERLYKLIAYFRASANQLELPLLPSNTPIQPLLVGDSEKALRLSEALLARGILIAAIRPPSVPQGSARLRITLSAAHQETQIDRLLENIADLIHHNFSQ